MCHRLPHRGRFQAQGDGLEESQPWAQNDSLNKEQGRNLNNDLKNQLSEEDRNRRLEAFRKAEKYINDAPNTGIRSENSPKKSFFSDARYRHIRVDVEISAGKAFVD